MRELFRRLARDCNYRDEKLCNVSKADCIAYCFQSSEALGGFRSFLKLYMYITNRNFYVRNHVSQKAKCKISTEVLANRETEMHLRMLRESPK